MENLALGFYKSVESVLCPDMSPVTFLASRELPATVGNAKAHIRPADVAQVSLMVRACNFSVGQGDTKSEASSRGIAPQNLIANLLWDLVGLGF